MTVGLGVLVVLLVAFLLWAMTSYFRQVIDWQYEELARYRREAREMAERVGRRGQK